MAGLFDLNQQGFSPQGFDPNAPQGYDYNAQQQRIALQQALAKQLGQGLGEGRMVGGWYAAPSKGAYIANALQQALGGYLQVKNSDAQASLDKADRDAVAAARKSYADASDPSNYIDKAREASPIPEDQYMYKDMSKVGPPDPRKQVPVPLADPRPPVFSGTTPEFGMSRVPGSVGDKFAGPEVTGQNFSPAPWADESPATPVQQVGVSAKRESPFDVTPANPADVAASQKGQLQYLQRAMAADRQNALDLMSRTKAGAPLASAIMARDYSPTEWDFQKVKNGDVESLIAVNKRNPDDKRVIVGGDTGKPSLAERKFGWEQAKDERDAARQAKLDADAKTKVTSTLETTDGFVNVHADGSMTRVDGAPMGFKQKEEATKLAEKQTNAANAAAGLNDVRSSAMQLSAVGSDGKSVFDRAVGTTALIGRGFAKATGRPNDYTDARAQIETVQAQALPALMAEMKASGASPSQMMNTEAEAKRMLASRFSIDPDKMSPAMMKKNLEGYLDYISGLRRAAQANAAGATPSTAAPQGVRLDWTKK